MTQDFDPYHRWLGISPKDQPPDHYRLLGIDRFESDPEVIRDAAMRQMGHVRSYQLGPQRDLSQRILNELGAAKGCLQDATRRAAYDSQLRQRTAAPPPPPEPPPPNQPSSDNPATAWLGHLAQTTDPVTPRDVNGPGDVGGRPESPDLAQIATSGRTVQRQTQSSARTSHRATLSSRRLNSFLIKLMGEGHPHLLRVLRTAALIVPLVVLGVALLAFFPRRSSTTQSRVPKSPPQRTLAVVPGKEPSRKPAKKPKPAAEEPKPQLLEEPKSAAPLSKPASPDIPPVKSSLREQARLQTIRLRAETAKRAQENCATSRGETVEVANSIGIKLVLIPPGEFLMGSPEENPQHRVQITKPFYLGVYEVTQGQYQKVVGSNRSRFKGESLPVETVSWNDAVAFCKRLSEVAKERATGRTYRLPTEAEWEYACRAGSTSKYSFGDSEAELGKHAWYKQNSDMKTHPVGKKQPNVWGLYDMHGNVFEWCQDGDGGYEAGPASDPSGPDSATRRVLRGGSGEDGGWFCRSAFRFGSVPGDRKPCDGFRVALVQSDAS